MAALAELLAIKAMGQKGRMRRRRLRNFLIRPSLIA